MAVDNKPASFQLLEDLIEDLQLSESPLAKKANTVTSAIGTVATILAAIAADLLASGIEGLPSWLPGAVVFIGMLGTTLSVAKTKNGVTPSVADKIRDGLADRIDLEHFHELTEQRASVSSPEPIRPVDDAAALRSKAYDVASGLYDQD